MGHGNALALDGLKYPLTGRKEELAGNGDDCADLFHAIQANEETGELAMTETGVEPTFDPLRGEARFQNLLQRLGLAR